MIQEFFKKESAAGILLMVAGLVAVVTANSPLQPYYQLLLSTVVEVRVGSFGLAKPLLLWINDGLMAVFFFLVGLELKRELVEGELSNRKRIALPAIGAVGGMAVPAAIYAVINRGDPVALDGWAIPAATDIAFALGILALLGSRVPLSLKVFLTSLAIFDDVGAIAIIALFYTENVSISALVIAVVAFLVAIVLNRKGIAAKSPYLLLGVIMWVAMIKSGVHATLAGVLLALSIPLRVDGSHASLLKELEHDLHHAVAFFVLPVFAFANAGISLTGITTEQLLHGVPVGIAAGLFVGKQIGIFGLCWLAIRVGIADLPSDMNYRQLYGVAALCGVGFTMSLFIGTLAFEATGFDMLFDERLGIIAGSLASAILGYTLLRNAGSSNRSLHPTASGGG
jgi:NhaA family Na+:H+ antiporter